MIAAVQKQRLILPAQNAPLRKAIRLGRWRSRDLSMKSRSAGRNVFPNQYGQNIGAFDQENVATAQLLPSAATQQNCPGKISYAQP